jgi:hypothetical protein
MDDKAFYNLYFGKWNFCGCGDPEGMVEYIRDVLAAFKERVDTGWKVNRVNEVLACDNGPYWFVLYWLDSQGFTEHGSSASGSWLTKEGEELLAYLQQHTFPEVLSNEFFLESLDDWEASDKTKIAELTRDKEQLQHEIKLLRAQLAGALAGGK